MIRAWWHRLLVRLGLRAPPKPFPDMVADVLRANPGAIARNIEQNNALYRHLKARGLKSPAQLRDELDRRHV